MKIYSRERRGFTRLLTVVDSLAVNRLDEIARFIIIPVERNFQLCYSYSYGRTTSVAILQSRPRIKINRSKNRSRPPGQFDLLTSFRFLNASNGYNMINRNHRLMGLT